MNEESTTALRNDNKPTPGPWFACVYDPMERPHVTTVKNGVCDAKNDVAWMVRGNLAANAHLIAAAPDMYAVLVDVADSLDHMSEPDNEWTLTAIRRRLHSLAKRLEPAIAKAEGR